jgi:DNA-nicking Smr family endonuclease
MAILKPQEALKIMAEYDCEMTLASLYAWIRNTTRPCPFGVYTTTGEGNERGGYTIFRGRMMAWLECRDMAMDYNSAKDERLMKNAR